MAVNAICRIGRKSALCLLAGAALLAVAAGPARADEPETLDSVLEKHRLATFEDVGKYVQSHPDAKDIDESYFYLFREGLLNSMEVPALPYAEMYLKREQQNAAISSLAQRVRCMGMADQGHFEEAYAVFESLLAQARPQSAEGLLGIGFTLASKARAAQNVGISRDIYERMSAAFPFNEKVTKITQAGLVKHDLLDKPAPELNVPDLEGKTITWEQYRGKVVLVDFWATWCGPCLEEIPNLKKVYSDLHDQGFEIIGINRDEDVEQVKKFLVSAEMPWPQIMDETEHLMLDQRFNATMLPSTYLVDRNGILVQFDVRGGEIRSQVEQLLKKK